MRASGPGNPVGGIGGVPEDTASAHHNLERSHRSFVQFAADSTWGSRPVFPGRFLVRVVDGVWLEHLERFDHDA